MVVVVMRAPPNDVFGGCPLVFYAHWIKPRHKKTHTFFAPEKNQNTGFLREA
jgi:hypothetical protein